MICIIQNIHLLSYVPVKPARPINAIICKFQLGLQSQEKTLFLHFQHLVSCLSTLKSIRCSAEAIPGCQNRSTVLTYLLKLGNTHLKPCVKTKTMWYSEGKDNGNLWVVLSANNTGCIAVGGLENPWENTWDYKTYAGKKYCLKAPCLRVNPCSGIIWQAIWGE